jgi:RNA polymerase sigma factor (sigma-70 family)
VAHTGDDQRLPRPPPGGLVGLESPAPGTRDARAEFGARIAAAFQRLSARQREVFALRYIEGMSTHEVAGTLDLSEGSVKRHLFRAVKYLRGALGEIKGDRGLR